MEPILTQGHWAEWCNRKGLDLNAARFGLETCYYGKGIFKTRPGTLIVYDHAIIHHSYSPRDTVYAFGSKGIRVEMLIREITEVRWKRMSGLLRAMQMNPESLFEIKMYDGTTHDIVLHRLTREFERTLTDLGVKIDAGERSGQN